LGYYEILILLVFFSLGFLGIGLWIWMLIDCVKNEPSGNDKIMWVIIIIFTGIIGAAMYLFIRRPKRKTGPGG